MRDPSQAASSGAEPRNAPEYFHDLALGRLVAALTANRREYDLAPLLYAPPGALDVVVYRQDVMRDMEDEVLQKAIGTFAGDMRTVRWRMPTAGKRYHELERQRWLLAAVQAYTDAAQGLLQAITPLNLASRGLRGLRTWLEAYTSADAFRTLADETRELAAALAAIRFELLIRGGSVTVRPYSGESDYSDTIEETFRKFREGAAKDYREGSEDSWGMNHVQAQIAERVARLEPGTFATLARFCERHADFVDPTLARFDREIQIYAAYGELIERFRGAGLTFCYPALCVAHQDVAARGAFDLALADELIDAGLDVVCNDFQLDGPERVLVVTGPNQGGKTTFARMFGQLHYLASLGFPVPGREARLLLCDRIFTHFEREEDVASLRGKLEDDLVRIHRVLNDATSRSIVIMNEIFSSTTLIDALYLGREVLRRIIDLDVLCVCVTFLDDLATTSAKTVSMVAGVAPDDPRRRTFQIARRPPDGLAYALSVAEHHRVTARWLDTRIGT